MTPLGCLSSTPARSSLTARFCGKCGGPNMEEESHYLRVYVGSLRKKIECDPSRPEILMTEPGVGYRIRIIR